MGCTSSVPEVIEPNAPAPSSPVKTEYKETKASVFRRSATTPPGDSLEDRRHPFERPLDVVREEQKEVEMLARITHFDEPTIQFMRTVFDRISDSKVKDGVIDVNEFAQALGVDATSTLCQSFFRSFSLSKMNSLSFREFVSTLSVLSTQASLDEKLRFSFNLCDMNKDGLIEFDELQKMLRTVVRDSNIELHLSDEDIRQICERTFQEVDRDNNGVIDFEEYAKIFKSRPGILFPFTVDTHALFDPKRRPVKRMENAVAQNQVLRSPSLPIENAKRRTSSNARHEHVVSLDDPAAWSQHLDPLDARGEDNDSEDSGFAPPPF